MRKQGRPSKPNEERFQSKYKKNANSGCWDWTASTNKKGYGRFWNNSTCKRVAAHRFSWELHNGPIPDGLFVCHKCDNPKCVNPDHLFTGTATDNNRDRMRKGRHVRSGYKNGGSKLTKEQANEIREKHRAGVLRKFLAGTFGVSCSHIKHITNNKAWAY